MELEPGTDFISSGVSLLVKSGIAAVKAGQHDKARELLLQAVELDELNINAWLWLSAVVESREEKEVCLSNVLSLDPTHKGAQEGLARLQKQDAASPAHIVTPPANPTPPPTESSQPPSQDTATSPPAASHKSERLTQAAGHPSPSSYSKLSPHDSNRPTDPLKPGHLRQHASIAASILQPGFAARQKPGEQDERETAPDVFANDYLCPACAKTTRPADKRCPNCHQKLWTYIPRRAKTSKLYRFLMWNVGANIVITGFFLVGLILAAIEDRSFRTSGAFYFGLGLLGFITTYYAILLVGYIKRWRLLYYLNVIAAILVMTEAGANALMSGLTSSGGMVCGGFLFFLGVIWFFMVLSLGDDFAFDKYRLLLKVDSDVRTAKNLFHRGHHYSQQNMWGLAAVHYRRAAGQMPDDINCHLALAMAYLRLQMYDKADEALNEARRISTIDPLLHKLTLELENKRPT